MSKKHNTYVVVIDAANEYSLEDDFTNSYMKKHEHDSHVVKVIGVREMIHSIAVKAKGKHLIGLRILGHGAPGVQGVGASSLGHVSSGDKEKDPVTGEMVEKKWHKDASREAKKHPHLEPGPDGVYDTKSDTDGIRSLRTDGDGDLVGDGQLLRHLKGKFTSHAVVVLGGCKVGAGEKGDALLNAVSAILGNVRVQAGVETQFPLQGHCEGPCKEAFNGGVKDVDADHQSKIWGK